MTQQESGSALNNGSGVSLALTSDHYTKGEVDNQIGGLGIVYYYNKTEVDDKLADYKYTLTSELPTGLSDVVTEDPTFVMTSSFGIKMVHRHLGGYYPNNFITEQRNIPVPTSGVASLQYLVEELTRPVVAVLMRVEIAPDVSVQAFT